MVNKLNKKIINKKLVNTGKRAIRKKITTALLLVSSILPACDSNVQFYGYITDCKCKCEDTISDSPDSSRWTDAELSSCNPHALASGRIGIGEELELKKGVMGFIVKIISIDLSNYEVSVDILTLEGKESKKGVKVGIGEERKETIEVALGVKKQVTIGVCEEGTNSKGANIWATF